MGVTGRCFKMQGDLFLNKGWFTCPRRPGAAAPLTPLRALPGFGWERCLCSYRRARVSKLLRQIPARILPSVPSVPLAFRAPFGLVRRAAPAPGSAGLAACSAGAWRHRGSSEMAPLCPGLVGTFLSFCWAPFPFAGCRE